MALFRLAGVARLIRMLRKLRLIAASDLGLTGKLRYALNCARGRRGGFAYRLRGGASVALRKDGTDGKVFDEIFVEQVYASGLAALPAGLERITLVDLGAYTGLSLRFLAGGLERKGIRVEQMVAVEPDPDNFRLLTENLWTAGLANRTTAINAFAGAAQGFAEVLDSGNGAWGMRMGRLLECGTPVLPLAEIVPAAHSDSPVLLKCDIEGGERQVFLHIRDWEHLVCYILLELHTEFLAISEMQDCLESSRYHWNVHQPAGGVRHPAAHGVPPEGAVIAFFLLERGARRKEGRPERDEPSGTSSGLPGMGRCQGQVESSGF